MGGFVKGFGAFMLIAFLIGDFLAPSHDPKKWERIAMLGIAVAMIGVGYLADIRDAIRSRP